MARDKDEAGGPPNTSSGFLVMAKNRDYGVDGKLVERYDRAGDALYMGGEDAA